MFFFIGDSHQSMNLNINKILKMNSMFLFFAFAASKGPFPTRWTLRRPTIAPRQVKEKDGRREYDRIFSGKSNESGAKMPRLVMNWILIDRPNGYYSCATIIIKKSLCIFLALETQKNFSPSFPFVLLHSFLFFGYFKRHVQIFFLPTYNFFFIFCVSSYFWFCHLFFLAILHLFYSSYSHP